MSKTVYLAFQNELKKLGFSPRASAMLGGGGAGAGVGMLAGALGGAGVQGYRGYREAKEQGLSGRDAALAGVVGGAGGIGTGAMIGAGLGGAGGAALGHFRPEMAEAARAAVTKGPGPVGAFARFGQRQVHGLTGWHPGGEDVAKGLHELRHGSYNSAKALEDLKSPKEPGFLAKKVFGAKGGPADPAAIAAGEKRLAASQRAEQMGLTSIPGYAKSLVSKDPNKGVKNTLSAAINEQLHGTSMGEKALMLGLPAAQLSGTIMSHDDPNNPDPRGSKGLRIAKDTAGVASGLLLGPMPQATQMLVGEGVQHALGSGAHLARKAGWKRGGTPMPPQPIPGTRPSGILLSPEQEKTVGPPPEYEVSPAAKGQAPEGVA